MVKLGERHPDGTRLQTPAGPGVVVRSWPGGRGIPHLFQVKIDGGDVRHFYADRVAAVGSAS